MSTQQTVFEKVLEPALPLLHEIEATRKKHGNEKLTWFEFVLILVYYFTKRCGSQASLVVALENADPALKLPKVPAMTLSDAFRRFSPALLRTVLVRLVATLDLSHNPELALVGQVHAADGSVFPVVGGLFWAKTDEVIRSVKLHLNFSLSQMVAVEFRLTEPETSERAALQEMLQTGVTYVVDRGYFAFSLYREIVTSGAHVVMRVYNNIVVETVRTLPTDLPKQVRGIWSNVTDRIVRSDHTDAVELEFRLVELKIGTSCYKLMTDRLDLTTFQVILLFAYRWQIELVFRFFKHTMSGIEVITQSRWGIENFFTAMFLTALLHLYFKVDCLEQAGHLPPTEPLPEKKQKSSKIRQSQDHSRPTSHLAAARFFSSLNCELALFWKVPKHWLETLADYLYRRFSPLVVDALNKHAFASLPPP